MPGRPERRRGPPRRRLRALKFISIMNVGAVNQALPGRDRGEWHRGGFAHGKVLGLQRQQVCIDRNMRGQRTLQASNAAAHRVDFVPGPKCTHFASGLLDHSCQIQPKNSRELYACMGSVSRPNLRVQRIRSTGKHAHQDLMSARSWDRHPVLTNGPLARSTTRACISVECINKLILRLTCTGACRRDCGR